MLGASTETVYGLAARLTDLEAIDQIFALKGRPSSISLIIHVSDISQINLYVKAFHRYSKSLLKLFGPVH